MVLPEYADCHGRNPAPEKYPLVLCAGVRRPQFFHSRTYRMPWLSDLEHHTLLDIHPEDAARLGIKDGDEVELTTPVGSHSYRACLNTGVLPGSVNVLHDDGNEQNINDLVSADYYDPISGFPGFRCYFCSVRRKER